MYKIHILVHVCGGVSSQAGGKWPARDRRPPQVCPASGPGEGRESCSPGHLRGLPSHTRVRQRPCPKYRAHPAGAYGHHHAGAAATRSPWAIQLGQTLQPTLPTDPTQTDRRQQNRRGPHIRPGATPLTHFGQRHPDAGSSRAPVGSCGPHPHIPTPGTWDCKGTGSREAGSSPELPLTRHSPPYWALVAPTCPSCPARPQISRSPQHTPHQLRPPQAETKPNQRRKKAQLFVFRFAKTLYVSLYNPD